MGSPLTTVDLEALAADLHDRDIVGVTIGWVDNNGIVRLRTVPTAALPDVTRRGVGITATFAVFDSHDAITFAHEGLSTPSGDVRLVPVIDSPADVVPLAGQPGFAWVNARQVDAAGQAWPYCQRTVLERQVAAAAEAGFEVRAGFEMEFALVEDDRYEPDEWRPAHRGPVEPGHGQARLPQVRCPAWMVLCEPAATATDGPAPAWQAARSAAFVQAGALLAQPRMQRWTGAVHDVPLQWPALVAGLIRAAADEVTASVTDDGVALVLERYLR